MKLIKPMYMVATDIGIRFTSDVTYLDDGYYRVKVDSMYGVESFQFLVRGSMVCKLDEYNINTLAMRIHKAVYMESDEGADAPVLNSLNKSEGLVYPMDIRVYSGGMVKHHSVSSATVVSCEEDIMSAQYVTIVRRGAEYYTLLACDESGVPFDGRTRTRASNPYSRNCCIVYNIVANNPGINTYDIIEKLGWGDTGRVTPRLSELVKGGRVKVAGKEYNPITKRSVSTWVVI